MKRQCFDCGTTSSVFWYPVMYDGTTDDITHVVCSDCALQRVLSGRTRDGVSDQPLADAQAQNDQRICRWR